MREYLTAILMLSALLCIGTLLSYRENDKTVRFAFSLILCAAVVLPIAESLGENASFGINLPSVPEDMGEGEYEKTAKAALEKGISELLCSKFDIAEENVTVFGEGFDFEKMRFSTLCVTLYGSAVFKDTSSVERFIKENFGGCDVKIRLG